MAGAVVGLVLGGAIATTIGWRWIFFVNVPIGVIATWRAHADLRELVRPEESPRFDWGGNVVFAGGLTLLLLGITLGALGDLPLFGALLLVAVSLVLLVLFPWIERHQRSP
ncbi:membrane protein, partial [mine drainage metagenome]